MKCHRLEMWPLFPSLLVLPRSVTRNVVKNSLEWQKHLSEAQRGEMNDCSPGGLREDTPGVQTQRTFRNPQTWEDEESRTPFQPGVLHSAHIPSVQGSAFSLWERPLAFCKSLSDGKSCLTFPGCSLTGVAHISGLVRNRRGSVVMFKPQTHGVQERFWLSQDQDL